jgi:hypothetical protein
MSFMDRNPADLFKANELSVLTPMAGAASPKVGSPALVEQAHAATALMPDKDVQIIPKGETDTGTAFRHGLNTLGEATRGLLSIFGDENKSNQDIHAKEDLAESLKPSVAPQAPTHIPEIRLG